MPRKKQQSKEETLAKAKIARRNRYAKIKADPILYALEKEKERQRYKKRREQKKLLSVAEMTPRARRLQRKKWRENFRKHFQKKKLLQEGIKHMNENTPSSSDSEDNINNNENRPRRRNSICKNEPQPSTSNNQDETLVKNLRNKLRKMRYIIEKKDQMYKSKLESLQRKNNAYRKIIVRLKKRLQSPNSKVTALLRDKTKVDEAKKKILFGEAMRNTLHTNYKNKKTKKEKREFSDAVIGDKLILKDFKVLSETNNFRVRELKKTNQRNLEYEKLKQDIRNFFERDDISRATSGKKEFITQKKERKQKRYLLDTMKNLHKIFETEFCKVSYSYFCKHRPFWVLIPNVNQRDTCLCKLHANIEFLIQALHKKKIIKNNNSNDLINSICCSKTECLLERCNLCKNKVVDYQEFDNDDLLSFKKWENSISTYVTKGVQKTKKIIAKTKVTTTPKQAIEVLESIIPLFLKHEGTRRWQFTAVKDLKEHLKDNEAIIHIDFSENYALKYESEVQAFHFGGSRQELTLHTAVIYMTDDTSNLTNTSFCTVSENLRHDSAAIWAHIIPLLEFVNSASKKIDTLHFLSDSPSSQYRNKTMFYVISKLWWYFHGLKMVTWNYFESAHGKGAADGVGAVVKRTADAAVAQGRDVVTLDGFLKIVRQNTQKINLATVEEYQIIEKDMLIPSEQLKPLKGTMKVHQILWQKNKDHLIFRETSCFICFDMDCKHTKFVGKLYCEDKTESTHITNKENVNNNMIDATTTVIPKTTPNNRTIKILSNILIKPKRKTDEINVKMLSDLKPDNKLHLDPDIHIENMVNQYNISGSGSDMNFSGIFQDYVQSTSQLSANEITDGQHNVLGSSLVCDDLADPHETASETTGKVPSHDSDTDSDSSYNIF